MHGSELTSHSSPPVRLKVQTGFTYLGRIKYAIDSTFEGERYIFADSEGKQLRRLVIVQFEHFTPASHDIYHYDVDGGQQIGSLRFVQNAFAFAGARQPVASPRDEADRSNNFLLSRGFQMPGVWLVTRFVTVGNADRKSEMIIAMSPRPPGNK